MTKVKNDFMIESFLSFKARDLPFQTTATLFVINGAPDKAELVSIIKKALSIGSKYFLSWGENSGELHDLFDDVILVDQIDNHGFDYEPLLDDVVMTTDHTNETAEDVIFYMLNCLRDVDRKRRFLILYDIDGSYIEEIRNLISGGSF